MECDRNRQPGKNKRSRFDESIRQREPTTGSANGERGKHDDRIRSEKQYRQRHQAERRCQSRSRPSERAKHQPEGRLIPRPGRADVCAPLRTTAVPLTKTSRMPEGNCFGFSYVAVSIIFAGSKITRSANAPARITPRSVKRNFAAGIPVIL